MPIGELLAIIGMVIALIVFIFMVQKKNNYKKIAANKIKTDDS